METPKQAKNVEIDPGYIKSNSFHLISVIFHKVKNNAYQMERVECEIKASNISILSMK